MRFRVGNVSEGNRSHYRDEWKKECKRFPYHSGLFRAFSVKRSDIASFTTLCENSTSHSPQALAWGSAWLLS